MVIVPLREPPVELAATQYHTVPFPAPEEFEVMITQETLLIAVQVHPFWAAISTFPVPPVELKEFAAGEREKAQGEGPGLYTTSFEYPLSWPDLSYAVAAKW